MLHAAEAGSVTVTADDTLDGTALSGSKQITVTPTTLTIQQDTSGGIGSPPWTSCGMLGSDEGQSPGCLVTTTKKLQEIPVPAWFTIDTFRLIVSGRAWTAGDLTVCIGTCVGPTISPGFRVINVATGQPLQNGFVVPAGATLDIAVQTQSTAGVQKRPTFSVQFLGNSGTSESAISEFITVTTN